uniref:PNPLA domain-containing protein n=1 Tax=Globodera pallida TaxID=36090 RepID=A0A183BJE8_GLOPA
MGLLSIDELSWDPSIDELSWDPSIDELSWDPSIDELTWYPSIDELSWDPSIDELSWDPSIDELSWDPSIDELSWDPSIDELDPSIDEIVVDRPLDELAVYDEIFQKLADLCAEGHAVDHNFINVLSLDGGGIRGLVILQILVCIERILGEPIFPYFDWVAGTSTGALITAGLTMGQSLREIQRLYLRFKDLVFDNRRPHNTRILELFIRNELGSDTKFSDLKDPMILFTTTRADFFPVQLELMRNYKLPTTDEENEELGYETPENLLLWKVLRRSSAAPTYFASVDNKYIDGGIIANNPTLELLQEVQFWNSFNRYKNLPNSVNIGCVLSIGTGAIPPSPLEPTYLELAQNWATQPITSFNVALTIGSILVDQVTATEGVPVLRSGSVCLHARAPFFRLSAPLFKNIEMDAKDDADTARMMWNCMEYMYKHRDYVEKLCALLRRVGHACHRRHMFQQFGTRTQQDQQTQTSRSSSPAGELLKMLNTDNISNKQQQKDDDEGEPVDEVKQHQGCDL